MSNRCERRRCRSRSSSGSPPGRSRGASARSRAGASSFRPSACSARCASLGIARDRGRAGRATSADDAGAVRALLDAARARARRRLPAGRPPRSGRGSTHRSRRRAARRRLLARRGGAVSCSAAVVDDAWSAPRPARRRRSGDRSAGGAARLVDEIGAEHGARARAPPARRARSSSATTTSSACSRAPTSRSCLDTGHLPLGGFDPRRVRREAPRTASATCISRTSTPASPTGCAPASSTLVAGGAGTGSSGRSATGMSRVDEVVRALEHGGYPGWYVLEQDTAIDAASPPTGRPVDDVRHGASSSCDGSRRESSAAPRQKGGEMTERSAIDLPATMPVAARGRSDEMSEHEAVDELEDSGSADATSSSRAGC